MHFPNLNSIRFIAACLVIVHHIEQFKDLLGLDSAWQSNAFIEVIGRLGVVLFFVLSGFLISLLLLKEEEEFNRIDIKAFYLRRVLRIWPLYFLIVFLSLGVFPYVELLGLPSYPKEQVLDDLQLKISLFVFFLPNLVLSSVGVIPYASQTWSIGTEEQFYLLWPLLMTLVRRHRIMAMVLIIGGHLFIRIAFSSHSPDFPGKSDLAAFWDLFSVHCMAIGGIAAVLLFTKSKLLRVLFNRHLFNALLIITLLLICFGVVIPFLHIEIYSVLFAILILNLAANEDISISLESPILNYLGKISYGLYMYHAIFIVVAIRLAKSFESPHSWIIYILSFLSTILISAMSYSYFEKPFLKLKERFARVKSSP